MLFVALQELELNFNRLSEMNLQLRKEKAEAAAQLGARSAEKAALEAQLATLKVDAGKLEVTFKDKLASCERMSAATVSMLARRPPAAPFQPPPVYTPSGKRS
ncbi:hypothetical protein EYF80_064239 [Liparis tanakae]|uniref:Uncharacterized protein n=1 Tax=Liparis tanakae TaxID=230148 RepID=A0A4Z2EAP1_9TELE|nr:hypothetical protein EYF80_064239 [Liparis tanakae]